VSKEAELIAGAVEEVMDTAATLEEIGAHVVSKLSEHGYSIVHHRPTCAEAGDSCKHLPECVMAICVCGEEWPCPTVAAAAEEDQ